jgi:threonyl-tRNA synthetase
MYATCIDEEDFCIKPMNCPGSVLIYASEPHSYRELPMRLAELGTVHRHELKGTLHGLFRVRSFTQDDAHIFMRRDQIAEEIARVVNLIDTVYSKFGFEYFLELSTRPEDSMGSDEAWEIATNGLQNALDENGIKYVINEGDGAFYGPKIDFHLEDSIGRTWQCGTIQLDMQMPERFELEYTAPDGSKKRPVMIHRVCFGSIERFIGILIEHFAGAFPVWLSPVQVKVLPISEKFADYANSVAAALDAEGIRVETDHRAEKIGYKIREARNERTPYIIVVGEKDVEANAISLRSRKNGEEGQMALADFIARIKEEVATKVLD